jgi:hypothetical protein
MPLPPLFHLAGVDFGVEVGPAVGPREGVVALGAMQGDRPEETNTIPSIAPQQALPQGPGPEVTEDRTV